MIEAYLLIGCIFAIWSWFIMNSNRFVEMVRAKSQDDELLRERFANGLPASTALIVAFSWVPLWPFLLSHSLYVRSKQ